ncbi:Myelin protein zero-like protein 1 [Collichthys lucidus]|nr:Myelin protein zero-like protein 1 [Collichthys lucidus]
MHTDPEVIVQNGTTGTLRCTFKSSEVISNSTSVFWTYHRFQPDNWFTLPYLVFLFSEGNEIIPDDYKDRVQFIGDMNKNDVSIQLSPIQFSDNGTFFCDVKNPPDVTGTPGRTMLKVVPKVTKPTSAIVIHADSELVLQNGTTGTLRCTFKSNEVVSSFTSVTWSFQSSQPDTPFSNTPHTIFYFSNGKGFPGPTEFKDRVQFIGDINKRDVSIQLSPTQFSDNGTFFCDVKNPPDVTGTPARTELRVVLRESLPQSNTTIIVGAVCGALFLLVLIAVAACIVMRVLHNRHDYEGCTSLESVSSQAPKPRKKVESSLEGSRSTSPSGPLQGPVIYAQLDHSGSKNSFHKMEPVVYADIRKN